MLKLALDLEIKKKFIDKKYCLEQNTAKRIGLKYFTNDK